MRIAVTGASGLIGTALVTNLQRDRHEVVRLVRRPPRDEHEAEWDPARGTVDLERLQGVEAAVHLAGAGVGDKRWNAAYRRTIMDSRVQGTRTLVSALKQLDPLPRVLVSGSAIGVYGDRGDEELTEASEGAPGFLADVVRAWEAEADAAAAAGIRVAKIRTGLVMSAEGGAFGRLLPLIRLGLGGPLGNGRQIWPFITLHDEVAAIRFLLDHEVSGPVNLTAPNPVTNREVVKALARAFHRPALLPVPGLALRVAVGEFSHEILASQRVLPSVLQEAGFVFRHPDVESAATWVARA